MEGYILNWFEVPAMDFTRAKKFYESILNIEMDVENMDSIKMGYFPFYNGKPTGCILEGYGAVPDTTGVIIYLNGDPDLSVILGRVEAAGGKIMQGKSLITPEYGYYAFFQDTEGNKIGLQSGK